MATIQERIAFVRDLIRRRRQDEEKQKKAAPQQSQQRTSKPARPEEAPILQRRNASVMSPQERVQLRRAQSAVVRDQMVQATPSLRDAERPKTPSIADTLWFAGAKIRKTTDDKFVPDTPPKKSKKGKKGQEQELPMLRRPSVEYLRDPNTNLPKDVNTLSVSDIFLVFEQMPQEERDQLYSAFEQDFLKRRSSGFYAPYYTQKSNNQEAIKLWGTDDLTSIVTNPENLKYLDYVKPNKNGQTPKAPTKKSSLYERRGYSLFYLLQDYEDEMQAKAEMPTLYRELGELAKAYPDASEDEILAMVDWDMTDENGNKAFKTINAYREAAKNYMEKYTVGGGLYIDDEPLKAVIRSARRGEDVSEVKDWLREDTRARLWQMMADENEGRRPQEVPPGAHPSMLKEHNPEQSVINKIGENFQNNMGRIGAGLGSLAGKAVRSIYDAAAPLRETLGIRQEPDLQAALEQSIAATGKIDLRDPSIPESQWDFLIQAGLASAEQRDAILAQRQAEQGAERPEYTGMTRGGFEAQSAGTESTGMSLKELVDYRATLKRKYDELEKQDQEIATMLPAIDQQIEALNNDLSNGADPKTTNAKLQELYQQRDALAGSAQNQANREAMKLRLQSEIANANEGISTLRTIAMKRAKAAQQQKAVQTKPAETAEQRTARLMSANIDELSAEASNLEKIGKGAIERHAYLTERIKELEGSVGQMSREAIDRDPYLLGLYNELIWSKEELAELELANVDVDLSDSDALNTSIMRKKQEVLDAAWLQYTMLPEISQDFTFYASKGESLPNPEPTFGFGFAANLTPDGISNPATYARDNMEYIAAAVVTGAGNKGDATLSKLYNMGFMEDSEVQIYSYLLANKDKYGPEKAELYYQSLLPQLKARQGVELAGALKDKTALQIMYGGVAGLDTAMQGIAQALTPNEIRPYSASQVAGMYIREDLQNAGPKLPEAIGGGSLAQAGYDLVFTMGNMLPSVAANAATPGIGPAVIGASAGGNAYNQSLREGHTQDEAARFAVLTGLAEASLESVLGMAATGGGKLASMVGRKTATAMSSAAADVVKGLAATMASNGTEEYFQEVLVHVFDTIAYGEEFQGLDLTDPEALRSGIMGALIAVIGDSPDIAAKVVGTKAIGRTIDSPEDIAMLLEGGMLMPEGSQARVDTEAAMDMVESGEKLGDYRTGKLVQSISTEALNEAQRQFERRRAEQDAQNVQSVQNVQNVQIEQEAEPEQPDLPEVELSAEAIADADLKARQAAYAASRDQKNFTPPMLRLVARVEAIEAQIHANMKAWMENVRKVDELKADSRDALIAVANGEMSDEAGVKRATKNAQESARAKAEIEEQQAAHSALSDQLYQANNELSKAKGELYQATYQIELNKNLNIGRETAIKMLREAEAARQLQAEREAAAARVAELDAEIQEIDSRDLQLGAAEEFAKKAAQQALDRETAALNAIESGQGTAEAAEQASADARNAYDQLQAVQKQREQNQANRERLGKERAELMNKYAENPATIIPNQPKPGEAATTPMNLSPQMKDVLGRLSNNESVPIDEVMAVPEIAEAGANVSAEDTSKINTPDRESLRADVLAKLQSNGSYVDTVGKEGYTGDVAQNKRIDIVVGLPASGKSSVLVNPISRENKSRVIDSDMAKELLPEYNNGMGASAVHEESKAIINKMLEDALRNGDNIVLPIIGADAKKLTKQIQGFKEYGYTVYLHLNELPSNKAIGRALNRFIEEGRYIPPAILYEYGNRPTDVFNEIIAGGYVDGYSHYSNDVERGEPAKLIRRNDGSGGATLAGDNGRQRGRSVGSVGTTSQGETGQGSQDQAGITAPSKTQPKQVAQPSMQKEQAVATESVAEPVQDAQAKAATLPLPPEPVRKPVKKPKKAETVAPVQAQAAEVQAPTVTEPKKISPRKLAEANGSSPLREGVLVGEYIPRTEQKSAVRRVSDVAKELYSALGVKYTSKNRPSSLRRVNIALYENHPGVVVTRTFQNVAAYAHELGHAIFERAKAFDGLGDVTDSFRADIKRMVDNLPKAFHEHYEESSLPREAAAEFVRAYLTDRNAAVNFAGEEFVRRFETEILSSRELKSMRRAREQFNATLNAEIVDNYRARIDYSGKQELARGKEGAWGKFIQGFADRYYGVLLFDIAANKLGYKNNTPNKRAYIAFSNIPYSVTQVANIIEQNLSTPDGMVIGESLKDVMRIITRANMEDWNTYITALHDIDRQAVGKPVFGDYTAKDSEAVARSLEQKHPEFKQARQDLMRWWNALLDEWVVKPNAIEDAKAKVDRFRQVYPNYVPTFRSKNDQVDVMTEEFGDMGGLLGQASVHFARAKGGDQAIKSPIASMVARVGEIVTATNKVLAMRRIHEAYQSTPGLGDWIREVPADKITGNGKDELLRIIDADGAVHHYQVFDKLLYDALLNSTTHTDGKLWDAIGALTGVFKQLTTMSNPFFALSNAMRDYTEAYVKGSNANPVTFAGQWISALAQLTAAQAGKQTETVKAYYAAGGGDSSIAPRGMAGVQNMERTLYSKYFSDALRRMAAGNSFKERARGGADALHATSARLKETINAFNNIIEGSQRFAEFSRTYRKTGDAGAAMYASTNVTTDFRRSGSWDGIHKAGRVFAFMNAGIQGTYSWYRMAKEARFDGKAFSSKAIRAAVMWAMVPIAAKLLVASMGDDDKEAYDAMAENVKADNILIPKSLTGGKAGEFYKIPKPKGPLPAVGDAVGRALIEAMEKEGSWEAFADYGLSDWAQQSAGNLVDSVNPYGSPIFAPVLQIMMNQTWYGSPIESKWMRDENIAPANRIKDTTSSAAIWIAHLPGLYNNVSPIQVDYFLNQMFGIAGDYITGDVGNAIIDKVAGQQNNYKLGSSSASFIRSRIYTDPTIATDFTSSMYDLDSLLQGIVADAGQTGRGQDPYARLNPNLTESERKAAVLEAKKMTKKGGVLFKAKTLTSQHYNEIDAIQADPKLPEEDKVIKIREVKWKMILENIAAVNAAETFIKKYVKGTPEQFKKIYG